MKKLLIIILLLLPATILFSQSSDNEYSKEVKKEAKRYTKEGWKIFAGDNPMESQIDVYLNMKRKNAENKSYPIYIFGYYNAFNKNLNIAMNIAKNKAMQELTSQVIVDINRVITTETTEIIEGDSTKFTSKISDIFTISSCHNLNYTTVIKFYRENPDYDEFEVYVVLASDFLKELEKVLDNKTETQEF